MLEEFGSEKARPKVVKTYRPPWGVRRFKPPALFTRSTAARLREGGVLEVELRWRWLHRWVSLIPGYWFVHARPTAQHGEPAEAPPAHRPQRGDTAA